MRFENCLQDGIVREIVHATMSSSQINTVEPSPRNFIETLGMMQQLPKFGVVPICFGHLIEGERLQTLGIDRYLTAFRTRDRYLAAQPFRSVIDVCQFAEP